MWKAKALLSLLPALELRSELGAPIYWVPHSHLLRRRPLCLVRVCRRWRSLLRHPECSEAAWGEKKGGRNAIPKEKTSSAFRKWQSTKRHNPCVADVHGRKHNGSALLLCTSADVTFDECGFTAQSTSHYDVALQSMTRPSDKVSLIAGNTTGGNAVKERWADVRKRK